MPADPETVLALRAAVQRVASWTGAATPPAPAEVVTIARRLELAAHAEVERAIRRVREQGQDWAVIARLLGLDDLPCTVADPAALAFDYCAGLARPPAFTRPRFVWACPACGQTIADYGPAGSPASSQHGHAGGCQRLAAACAAWQHFRGCHRSAFTHHPRSQGRACVCDLDFALLMRLDSLNGGAH
jgi:hypothetical protein